MNTILAYDPGLQFLGWAVLRDGRVVDCGVVDVRSKSQGIAKRLATIEKIADAVPDHMWHWKPQEIAVEGYSGSPRASTALALGLAWGAVVAAARGATSADRICVVSRVAAIRAVGAASAAKDEVQRAVIAAQPHTEALLARIARSAREHAADAIAVGIAAEETGGAR